VSAFDSNRVPFVNFCVNLFSPKMDLLSFLISHTKLLLIISKSQHYSFNLLELEGDNFHNCAYIYDPITMKWWQHL